jgi:hypothetical protein
LRHALHVSGERYDRLFKPVQREAKSFRTSEGKARFDLVNAPGQMALQGVKPQPQVSVFFLRTHFRDRQPQEPLESEFQPQKIKGGAFPYPVSFAFPRQEINLLLGDERP